MCLMIKTIIFAFLFFFFSNLYSQQNFIRWDSIVVTSSGDTLQNAFAGGLNFPQFSTIDVDGNGIQDLFVFDRSGNMPLVFLYDENNVDGTDYIYAPIYDTLFPKMEGWTLLVDCNNDGQKDIFTSTSNGGIAVYRNDMALYSKLIFTKTSALLKDTTQSFIYVSPWDVPAICDVDNDGDIDILTFNIGGSTIEYYKNISVETYGLPDSLIFELADACWGKFEEAFGNCDLYLNKSCKTAVSDTQFFYNDRHAGSTELAIDLDGDRDKDFLVGDLICDNISMLTNGGDSSSAYMSAVDTQFPDNYPVNIPQFPAIFSLDVNHDGLDDLVAAPNAINISENYTGVWYYKNTGTSSIPNYAFSTSSFLQNEMIEVGEGANISFFDINADSLLDLIIGNYGYHQTSATYTSELSCYENVGTKNIPVYKLITRDYASIASMQFLNVYPTFGDIDDDGDDDMIIGESNGNIHLYTNSSGIGKTANFALSNPMYQNIDVGQYSTPQLIDVNRDQLLDLLIGERNGNINYYQNTGTTTNAIFTLVSDSFGGVNVCKAGEVSGYSVPCLTEIDSVGNYTLLVGTESGYIYQYQNIENNLEGIFSLVDTMYQNIWEGARSCIAIADLNNDTTLDLGIGNYRGGVTLYKNLREQDSVPIVNDSSLFVSIYPNPAAGKVNIKITGNKNNFKTIQVSFVNAMGQLVYQNIFTANYLIPIDVSKFSSGVYEVELKSETYKINQKVMIMK